VYSSIEKDVVLGAFSFQMDGPSSLLLRLIQTGTNIRSSYFQLPYGDQALFLYRRVFERLGMFPNVIFLEDFDFVLLARKYGRISLLPMSVTTSSRRWRMHGSVCNTLKNQVSAATV
jgi:hypothetical protein